MIYLNDIDFYAHIFGIKSRIFFNTLKKIDKNIESIIKSSHKYGNETNAIIFADHGMAQVNKILCFKDLLNHKEYGKKFFMALDGTMLRFWYFDDNIRNEIRSLFEDKNYGHFLAESEKQKFHLKFSHNNYFDDVFLLNQGYAIFPNFMSWNQPKAMHAYDPSYKEQRGALIFSGNSFDSIKTKKATIVDLMPTILEFLNIEIPPTVEGRSLCR